MAQLAPAVRSLIEDRLMPLGRGTPSEDFRKRLQSLSSSSVLVPPTEFHLDAAKACLAGLWLWHDFLDESHSISQEIDTPEGSWWHGIMHRREGDFWNSKYWFRRVGQHPAFAQLSGRLVALGLPTWEPLAFIDLCERAIREGGDLERTCQLIQREEWRVLFEYCVQQTEKIA